LPPLGGGGESFYRDIPAPSNARFAWLFSKTSTAFDLFNNDIQISEEFSAWSGRFLTITPKNGKIIEGIPINDVSGDLNGFGGAREARHRAANDGFGPRGSIELGIDRGAGWAAGLSVSSAYRTRYVVAYYDAGGTFISSTSGQINDLTVANATAFTPAYYIIEQISFIGTSGGPTIPPEVFP